MKKTFILPIILLLSISCMNSTTQEEPVLFKAVKARVMLHKFSIQDSSLVPGDSCVDSMGIEANEIFFRFNKSQWRADSSGVFTVQSFSSMVISPKRQNIDTISIGDSTLLILGNEFIIRRQWDDSVLLLAEFPNSSITEEIRGKVIRDSLHIPLFVEIFSDTVVSFMDDLTIEEILWKRKAILRASTAYFPECCPSCDTICVGVLRMLPYGIKDLVVYKIGEMVIPLHAG